MPYPDEKPGPEMPSARVSRKQSISLVWLIPILAALVGGWLAYKTYSERGPMVAIVFKSADGVVAGQTKVKYKDLVVGQVVAVDLSPDLQNVVVSARLDKDIEAYLTDRTRFWVERARITLQGISGLSTLTAGVHIAMDPSREGERSWRFNGLERPPIVTLREEGKLFRLHAETLESLSVGSPVTRRQIQVGQVVGYELDPDGTGVTIHIFIQAPHDRDVRPDTRFWVSSGLELKLTAEGLDLDTDSMMSFLVGAVSFETHDSLDPPEPAPENTAFELFRSREAVANREFVQKEQYVLFFQGSVRGLSVGAPVEFRGIPLGRVTDVKLQLNPETFRFDIPVMVEIEPGRIDLMGPSAPEVDGKGVIGRLVERGLRGQLKTGSLLTGQLYVDLDFQDFDFQDRGGTVTELARRGDFLVIPTVPTPLDALANRLKDFLAQVETWPLEQMGKDVGDSLRALKELMESDDLRKSLLHLETTLANLEEATLRLNRTVVPEAEGVIDKADSLMDKNAPLILDLKQLVQELSAAARSVRSTADYLGRHPESLIRGK